jgi:ribosomal protein S18 acetylase RimI-like enzyme
MAGPIVNLTIRPFEAADRPALEGLWGRVFPDDPPGNAPAVMVANKLKVQPELLLVGVLGDALIGAVMAGFDGVRGWIYHLAVAPESRRRGIATQLVRAAESGLRKLGCPKVNIQVRASNSGVVAFYESLGFTVEERISMGRRLEGTGMNDEPLPLAGATMEQHAQELFDEGLSPEEFAARWADSIGTFSLDEYRYRDARLQSWIHALGAILFRRPGAPTLEELRQRFLTTEEHEAIRKRSQEEF